VINDLDAQVKILNALGSVVATTTLTGVTTQLEIGGLSPGIYFVEIATKKYVEQLRFVKVD
jgi:hypothetical protein